MVKHHKEGRNKLWEWNNNFNVWNYRPASSSTWDHTSLIRGNILAIVRESFTHRQVVYALATLTRNWLYDCGSSHLRPIMWLFYKYSRTFFGTNDVATYITYITYLNHPNSDVTAKVSKLQACATQFGISPCSAKPSTGWDKLAVLVLSLQVHSTTPGWTHRTSHNAWKLFRIILSCKGKGVLMGREWEGVLMSLDRGIQNHSNFGMVFKTQES